MTVQNNTAQGGPGGYNGWWSTDGGDARGGGVYAGGPLNMTGCTVQNNRAVGGRGGDSVRYSYVPEPPTWGGPSYAYTMGGTGGGAFGGGVYVGGTAAITGGSLVANTARGGDGGLAYPKTFWGGNGGSGYGGGLYAAAGPVTVLGTTVTTNMPSVVRPARGWLRARRTAAGRTSPPRSCSRRTASLTRHVKQEQGLDHQQRHLRHLHRCLTGVG